MADSEMDYARWRYLWEIAIRLAPKMLAADIKIPIRGALTPIYSRFPIDPSVPFFHFASKLDFKKAIDQGHPILPAARKLAEACKLLCEESQGSVDSKLLIEYVRDVLAEFQRADKPFELEDE